MELPAALLTQRRLRGRPIEAGVLSSRTSNANPNPSTDAAAPWPPGFASAANK